MSTRTVNNNFSITELKIQLHALIRQGVIDERVTDLLIQNGEPLQYERQLWDYKLKQPTATKNQTNTPEEKLTIDREWANIAKDVASFHNSYGGYILFGVRDSPRDLVGYVGEFDVDELNKRVQGFTKIDIECSFRVLALPIAEGKLVTIGLLLIPQRHDKDQICVMRKDGPIDANKKPLFPKGSVFGSVRISVCKAVEW